MLTENLKYFGFWLNAIATDADVLAYDCLIIAIDRFAPLRLSSDNISKLRQLAANTNSNPHDLLNQIVDQFFEIELNLDEK